LNKNSLIPLLYDGEYSNTFPGATLEHLIRDFRKPEDYPLLMTGLINPIGVIPTLFPILAEDKDYIAQLKLFTAEIDKIKMETENAKLKAMSNNETPTTVTPGPPIVRRLRQQPPTPVVTTVIESTV